MSVARNTLYNIVGAIVPIAATLITIPLYVHRIGDARYGILAIVWLLLGYFGLFDLGLSRATANQVARLQNADPRDREDVFWNACAINAAIGVLGGILIYALGRPLMEHWLKMSGALRVEATSALPWLSVAVPLATFTGVLTGTLEGQRRFGVVNAIQACGTVLFQGAPLIAAYTTGPQLQVIIPAAVIARAISIIPFGIAVKSSLPVTSMPRIKMSLMRDLLSYGGWVSVTNLISPVLESFDRVLIGVILGAADIAYYAVPFSLVGRTRIFPFALSRTLFPYLSAEASDQASTRALGAISTLAAAAIPVTIIGMLLMRPFLEFWMGIGFAAHASLIGETLLCAIWINGVASIPFALLQAQGRPDVVAKFHLAEILPYIGLLWICLLRFGLLGAAIAWAVRAIIDAVLLIFATSFGRAAFSRLLPGAVLIAITWIPLYELPLLAGSLKVILECSIVVLALTWSAYTSPELRIYLRRAWDQVKLC